MPTTMKAQAMNSEMQVAVACPKCNAKIKKPLRALKDKSEFVCACGQSVRVKGRGFTDASKALDDFKKSISKLNMKITIKI